MADDPRALIAMSAPGLTALVGLITLLDSLKLDGSTRQKIAVAMNEQIRDAETAVGAPMSWSTKVHDLLDNWLSD
jgi:hypothetical protein